MQCKDVDIHMHLRYFSFLSIYQIMETPFVKFYDQTAFVSPEDVRGVSTVQLTKKDGLTLGLIVAGKCIVAKIVVCCSVNHVLYLFIFYHGLRNYGIRSSWKSGVGTDSLLRICTQECVEISLASTFQVFEVTGRLTE